MSDRVADANDRPNEGGCGGAPPAVVTAPGAGSLSSGNTRHGNSFGHANNGFAVFLSHSSGEKPAVLRVAERLKHEGLEPWVDVWCLIPGRPWQTGLAAGVQTSASFAYFVGPHGQGDWAREELDLAQDRAAKERDFRLFIVLLPGLPEPFDASTLPPFLRMRT